MAETKVIKARMWHCPQCGKGVLAPSKLRRIDTRRWCLPCSKKIGELIERECKVNQRKAQKAKKQAAKKAAKKRKKISQRRAAFKAAQKNFWMVDGIDLCKEIERICAHPHARERLAQIDQTGVTPQIFLRRRTKTGDCEGRANEHIRLWITKSTTRISVVALFCHELAHVIDDNRAPVGGGWGHGESWWAHFCELVYEAYGTKVQGSPAQNKHDRHDAIKGAIAQQCEWLVEGEPAPRKPKRPHHVKPIRIELFPMVRNRLARESGRRIIEI